jgi:Zn-dependent peptidase ImmA (M78 family)
MIISEKNQAQRKAEEVLALFQITDPSQLPVRVERIANVLGLSINYFNPQNIPEGSGLSANISGMIDGFTVFVNSEDHPKRQRFTIAHEIGHYLLHSKRSRGFKEIFYRDLTHDYGEGAAREEEANNFAEGLLMPDRIFARCVSFGTSDEILADMFKVSTQSIQAKKQKLAL